MFNPFKKTEPKAPGVDKNKETTASSEQPEEALNNHVNEAMNTPSPKEAKQILESSINDVKAYLEANNDMIDPGTMEILTGKGVEEFLADLELLNGSKEVAIKLEDLKLTITNALATLEGIEPEAEAEKDSVLETIRKKTDSNLFRAAFMTAMLFLKFRPDAQAADLKTTDRVIDKTERSVDDSKTDDGKTYVPGLDEFKSGADKSISDAKDLEVESLNLRDWSQLNLSNYYETDSDNISEANQEQIKTELSQFLNNLNADNITEVLAGEFKVFASSDPRPTSNWEGSNEKLTEARAARAIESIRVAINDHDFSNSGLNTEQIEQLKAKDFKVISPEEGVTNIVDLLNPDTGENYTEAEVEALSEAEKIELYKDCRRIDVDFLAKKIDRISSLESLPAQLEASQELKLTNVLSDWQDYSEVYYLVDKSPSMNKSYETLSDILVKQGDLGATKLKMGTFSNVLHELNDVNDLEEIVEKVKHMEKNGSSEERVLNAIVSSLEGIDNKGLEPIKLVLATDEPLQGINWAQLSEVKALATEKNVTIQIIHAHNRGDGAGRAIDLDSLIESYQAEAWEKFVPTMEIASSKLDRAIYNADLESQSLESAINRILKLNKVDEVKLASLEDKKTNLQKTLIENKLALAQLKTALLEGNFALAAEAVAAAGSKSVGPRIIINPTNIGVEINFDN